ncbi:hypothetical protein PX52LOC_05822 [Limnoglobus roseus]|uniref:Phage ABA sandwich domain-containing protein n=1 Tax=Limnoglobus roseus TaxID=2598579 RepID=A0A5C1AKR0_9BACT|nr:hypothetical protein PX52LOC_05822 [Limnoglobus roseus]
MTALAQIALEFCRECMGWDAKPSTMYADSLMVLREGERQTWRYADLNAVMEAVGGWCDETESSLRIGYGYGRFFKGEWDVTIDTSVGGATYVNRSPCHALLAACVEANRERQAVHRETS